MKTSLARRLVAAAATVTALAAQAADAPAYHPPVPSFALAFHAEVIVAGGLDVGPVDGGKRRIVPILGGSVSGPAIKAEVLPGGADWQVIREDGATAVYARYTLKTSDGYLISVANTGVRRGPAEVLKRLGAGERVDPASYYFRATPVFEVADGHYGWLRDSVFVCSGMRESTKVLLDCYVVR